MNEYTVSITFYFQEAKNPDDAVAQFLARLRTQPVLIDIEENGEFIEQREVRICELR